MVSMLWFGLKKCNLGKNLRLHSDPVLDIRSGLKATGLLRLLKDAKPKFKPPPLANHAKTVTYEPRDLEYCTHVLLIRTLLGILCSHLMRVLSKSSSVDFDL